MINNKLIFQSITLNLINLQRSQRYLNDADQSLGQCLADAIGNLKVDCADSRFCKLLQGSFIRNAKEFRSGYPRKV